MRVAAMRPTTLAVLLSLGALGACVPRGGQSSPPPASVRPAAPRPQPPAAVAPVRPVLDDGSPAPLGTLAEILGQRGEAEPVAPGEPSVVVLLLPLSGRYAVVGEQVRLAVDLAYEDHGGEAQLVVLDTAGSAEGAVAALEAADTVHAALAVLGPAGLFESSAAAEQACALALPLLPLSRGLQGSPCDDFVLSTISTPRDEARALALWAHVELGATRFGLLHPDNDYGELLGEGFQETVEALGGHLVASASYAPGTEDFLPPLERLLARELPGAKEMAAEELGFEVLFVADTAKVARRVLPYLKYARVALRRQPGEPGLQILGPASWAGPDIIDPAERITENVVFVSALSPAASDLPALRFRERFVARYGQEPSPYQAECYDTASLLFQVRETSGAASRPALRDALWHAGNRLGVTGVWTLRGGGELRRDLYLLTVQGDELRLRRSEEEERALRR